MTRDLIALDIGGTHARFARASIAEDGAIALDEPVTLKTSDYVSLETAWDDFERRSDRPVPREAAIAIAGPVHGETVRMTNNSWVLHPARLDDQLGLDAVTLINDFGAVAHAAASAPDSDFVHLTGPDVPLPASGTISVIGPGTGLGVAHFRRFADGSYRVQATEGGHIDFAPVDAIDDAILARMRAKHRRVSVERIVSGPGIVDIYATLAAIEKRSVPDLVDKAIWQAGMDSTDPIAVAAIERFCMALGSAAGDLALAHGAGAVVIAGGLGLRIKDALIGSGFAQRFRFKGRYEAMMAGLPVKLITHPQPGLFGAAAAFAREHLS